MYTRSFWYMKLNFWIQWGYAWQRVEYAINMNHRPQENGPPLFFFLFFSFFFNSSLLNFKLPLGQRCLYVARLILQQQQQLAKWAGTMLSDTELHLLVSTCGWLMCCFIYFLSCLSLIHPRMSLPMLCKITFTCSSFYLFFLQLLVPCADRQRLHVFTYHLHYNLDKVCWILNLYMALFLYKCQCGDNSTVEAERGPTLLPEELLSIL